MHAEIGAVTIQFPRSRVGRFNPVVTSTCAHLITAFDYEVISLCTKVATTGDIAKHPSDLSGSEASRDLVSMVTDKVIGGMQEWQARPFDVVYTAVLIDALPMRAREPGREPSRLRGRRSRPRPRRAP